MVLAATLDSGTTSSTVMVVSPLVALMVDQVQSLRAVGVKASIVSTSKGIPKSFLASESSLSTDSILFCAPEALVVSRWRCGLENPSFSERVVAVVVDEAHCISKWYAI